ncbi:MAG TPA: hypothetical protein VI687_03470, partial [Candidatus Limnocylindrales bacterium]|nr:hypothetical protein [Candidatus Limnocylindrales bacterium]
VAGFRVDCPVVMNRSVLQSCNTVDAVDEIANSDSEPRREQPQGAERGQCTPPLNGRHESLGQGGRKFRLGHPDGQTSLAHTTPEFQRRGGSRARPQLFSNT